MNEIEYVDAYGIKDGFPASEVFKIPMPPKMKAKEMIRSYYGNEFDDEDSDASTILYIFEQLLEWYEKQQSLLNIKSYEDIKNCE